MRISNNFIRKDSLLKLTVAIFVLSVTFSVGCMKEMPVDPLTPEERAWLSEHDGKIRLGHDPNAKPIDYIDENGKFQGLAADYVRLLEKRLNFGFDIVRIKTWDEVLSKAKNKEVDVLSTFTKTEEREHWMLFTEPYIVIPTVILTRDDFKGNLTLDTMKDMKVTFTKGWVIDDYLRQKYSHLNMQPAIDSDTALNNLITNNADAWVTALTVASVKIEENRVSNIRIVGKTDLSFNLAMASRKDWPILQNILKKGLSLISEEERSDIFSKWIHINQESILESRKFWISVFIIIGIALLPVIIIYYWNKTLKRKIEQKTDALENELKERMQAEEALRESNARHKVMISNISDVIAIMDTDGIITYKSSNIEKQFGWHPEDLIGTDGWATVHPDDLERIQKEFYNLLEKDNYVKTVEYRYKCKDGSYKFIELTAINLTNDSFVNGVLMNYHDISERKRAETALITSEVKHRTQFEKASDGIFVIDKQGKIIDVNESFAIMHGYTLDELLKLNLKELDAPETAKHTPERMHRIIDKSEHLQFEVDHYHKNGNIFPLHVAANSIDIGGEKYVIAFHRDLTELKNAEKEKKKLETKLQQAQKMESIGTLAGGIAHDFNNILSPIMMHSEILLEDIPKDSPLRSSLNEIFTSSLRARDLVKQILTFSRQDDHEIKLIKIQPIIKEALKLIRSSIPTSIEIKQYISTDCGIVKADPTQIHQIVMNLATNAYHAMEDAGGVLKVNLKQVELGEQDVLHLDIEPGPYACSTFADTGIGMDKDLTEKIFAPFFTTKELGKGTGMGLSVVHGIVKTAGGSISVYSEPGKGTEFRVYLPVVKSPSEKHETQTIEPIQGGIERILLVDDEGAIASIEKQILERLGYQVTS
jgi:PAS domain S-box-containing protein